MGRTPSDDDPDTLLSLNDAADLLGLHYMTVYRYVRSGRLPAQKEGGEWRVRRGDAEAVTIGSDPATRDGSRRQAATALVQQIRAGDEVAAWAVLQRALISGADPWELHTKLLHPAITEMLLEDRHTIGHHRALVVAERLTARLSPRFRSKEPTSGALLLAAPSGDHATLPVSILADLCRARNFRVLELGAHTPAASMVEEASRTQRLIALALCTSHTDGNDDSVAETLHALAHELPDVPVALTSLVPPTSARLQQAPMAAHFTQPGETVSFLESLRAGQAGVRVSGN